MKKTNEGFYVIENDTHAGKCIEEYKGLDKINLNEIALHDVADDLKSILQHLGDGAILDIGANMGVHSYNYSKVRDAKKIIAIEANIECIECLKGNIPDCHIIHAAVTHKIGECALNLEPNVGASHVVDGVGIKTITLDAYEPYLSDLVNNIPFTFIKMDIEGCEIDALKGAENFIKKYKPKMFIEVQTTCLKRKNYTEKDLIDIIHKYGYFCIPCPLNRGSKIQYDILCIPY